MIANKINNKINTIITTIMETVSAHIKELTNESFYNGWITTENQTFLSNDIRDLENWNIFMEDISNENENENDVADVADENENEDEFIEKFKNFTIVKQKDIIEKIYSYTNTNTNTNTTTNMKEKKTKPKKPKNAIKRPPSAYLVFCGETRPILKSENPDMKPQDIIKNIALQWRELQDKTKYVNIAADKKNEYTLLKDQHGQNNNQGDDDVPAPKQTRKTRQSRKPKSTIHPVLSEDQDTVPFVGDYDNTAPAPKKKPTRQPRKSKSTIPPVSSNNDSDQVVYADDLFDCREAGPYGVDFSRGDDENTAPKKNRHSRKSKPTQTVVIEQDNADEQNDIPVDEDDVPLFTKSYNQKKVVFEDDITSENIDEDDVPLKKIKEKKVSAYTIFCRKNRDKIKKNNGASTGRQIVQIINLKWAQLSDEKKQKYIIEASSC